MLAFKGCFEATMVSSFSFHEDPAIDIGLYCVPLMQEIIEPAATRRDSVSLRAWAMCAALLEKAVLQGQMVGKLVRSFSSSPYFELILF